MKENNIELDKIWSKIVEVFVKDSDVSAIDTKPFLEKCQLMNLDNVTKTAFIVCQDEFTRQMFTNNYRTQFQDAANKVTNTDWKFSFQLIDDFTRLANIESTMEFKLEVSKAPDLDTGIKGKYTFENYFSNQDNQETAKMAKAVAKSPSGQFNPLFIYGKSGCGKTHLLQAIGHYVIKNMPNLKVKYISSDEFGNLTADRLTIKENRLEAINVFIQKYKDVDVLLLDDIQILSERAKTKDVLFQIIDSNLIEDKQIVFSSDRNPSELLDFEDRFKTRFVKGVVLQVKEPDFQASRLILQRILSNFQEFDSNDVEPEVIDYIARNYNSNGRELEGAINKLLVWSIVNDANSKITLENAKTILSDISKSTNGVTIAKIKNVVTKHYGLTLDLIEGESRVKEVVLARQVAMYLARTVIDATLKGIGDSFGSKDHSTVKSSIAKIEKKLKTDEMLKTSVDKLKEKLRT